MKSELVYAGGDDGFLGNKNTHGECACSIFSLMQSAYARMTTPQRLRTISIIIVV